MSRAPHPVIPNPLRRRLRSLVGLLLAGSLAACDDGPTAPGVYTHPADGQLWAAVVVPHGTPDLRTWMPYVRPDRDAGDAALREIRTTRSEAERLRRNGALEEARAREEHATRLAVRSLTHTPPPAVLVAALGALQTWSERAAAALEQGEFPELEAAAREIRELRHLAGEALQEGDTVDAVAHLAAGSLIIRAHAPEAVAGRVLVRAESRLARESSTDPDAVRALRLLRNAREALAMGDAPRALRRALYALQLAERRAPPAAAAVAPQDTTLQ